MYESFTSGRLTHNNGWGNSFFFWFCFLKSVFFYRVWQAAVLWQDCCVIGFWHRDRDRNLPQVARLYSCLGEGFYCVHAALLSLELDQEKRFLARGSLPGRWTVSSCLHWTLASPAVCPAGLWLSWGLSLLSSHVETLQIALALGQPTALHHFASICFCVESDLWHVKW